MGRLSGTAVPGKSIPHLTPSPSGRLLRQFCQVEVFGFLQQLGGAHFQSARHMFEGLQGEVLAIFHTAIVGPVQVEFVGEGFLAEFQARAVTADDECEALLEGVGGHVAHTLRT